MSRDVPAVRPRILCVDDEPRVLETIARVLRGRYTVVTALGAAVALAELERDQGFAVIVSDVRMPGMDGIAFLARARERAPDAVRVLLTGHAELEAAMGAVNHGHVFRFLQKPCHPDVLRKAVQAAVEQHRLITAERQLLDQTLRGSIRALVEVLALVSPAAFGRLERVQRTARLLGKRLALPDPWSIDVAAAAWHLGCVALSPTLADQIGCGSEPSSAEAALVGQVPSTALRLLAHIPRLEGVHDLLRTAAARPSDGVPLGAQVLRVALELDTLEARGMTAAHACDALLVKLAGFDQRLFAELRRLKGVEGKSVQVREMRLGDVRVGMVFADDVANSAGLLLIVRGQAVTVPLLARLGSSWLQFAQTKRVRMIVSPVG